MMTVRHQPYAQPGASRQSGQALLECLLVGALLMLLWLAGQWLGQAQRRVAQAGLEARRVVFQQAAGWPAEPAHDDTAYRHEYGHGQADGRFALPSYETSVLERLQAGGPDPLAGALREDFGAQAGMLAARVQVPAPPVPRVLAASSWPVRLPGALVLLGGQGTGSASGAGDLAVQQRIARAETAWLPAARRALAQAARLDRVMRRVDAPWRPGHEASAWLESWAGAVPPAGQPAREQP
ncbi:hypothetical protein [Kerstersia sp.]|uniref:hypothetical protein n=1 Tax=Kerstersia sp. TaxID=1930783 RepID=UPI003F907553